MGLSGPEITRLGTETLRAAGWKAYVFNFNSRMPRGCKGWCDVVAIKRGYYLFIEVKSEFDKLSEAQVEFREIIENNPARNVAYILAESPEDFEAYIDFDVRR